MTVAMPMMVTSEFSIELTMLSCIPLKTSSALVQINVTCTTIKGSTIQRILRNRMKITNINSRAEAQPSVAPSSST